ncbi:DUF1700 domain-containing protein [Silvimonas soli]|uniref:DUF1700 domain-containing protein n=1 Tax=Silvimonas soli TaxID=2980100 RepID=UPI0024B32859|nr:DUF1700 domain-containing protein [Silvimonas soli]
MNQQAFMSQLERSLAGLAQADIEQILADYAEYFRAAIQLGRREEDVAASLGDPKRLGRDLRVQKLYGAWQEKRTFSGLVRTVAAIARLGVLNFLLAIPFMIYLCVLTMGIFVSGALATAGLVAIVALGAHAAFGWPQVKPTDATTGSGDIKVVAYTPAAGKSETFRYRNDDVEIQLNNGDRIQLTDRNGTITTLFAQNGALFHEGSPQEGMRHGYRVAQNSLRAVDVKTTDGEVLDWSTDNKLNRIDWYEMDHNGVSSTVITPKAHDKSFMLRFNDDEFSLHASTAPHPVTKALKASLGVLIGAGLVLFLLLKLALMTWRAVVRYGRDQIAQIPLHLVL